MKKTIYLLTLTLAFALSAFAQTAPKPPSTHLKVGDAAPELGFERYGRKYSQTVGFQRQKIGRAGVLRARFYRRLNEAASGISG
jgi:hypothetical protein